jgi:aspartate aminotransferase
VYIPVPTWSNHHNIWKDAGCEERTFRYYKPETRGLDFEGMMEDIENAEEGSFFLLHACAHNPTGVDPSVEQWRAMSAAMKRRGLFPFFDMAYQGFASGDCERDAAAIRVFVEDGHKVGCSQSFAKNMGLYGQRIGCFSIMCEDADEAARVESQMKLLARPMYSNPPLHGAAIVETILGDKDLKKKWYAEVMADRIIDMRNRLRSELEATGSKLSWNHVTDQIGMFCFSGMTGEQVDKLRTDHHIYMTRNGRISMAGVTSGTVQRLAKAIHEVTK